MPKAKPAKGKSRKVERPSPYSAGSSANRMRRLQQRISIMGKPAKVRIRELMHANREKMTDEVRATMDSLLRLPLADERVQTDVDLLALYNYPLQFGVKQIQYNTLAWLMGRYGRTPGAGSLADVSLTADGVVKGRPGFSAYTQKYMKAVEERTGPNPANARRHVVAWHTIRELMNLLLKHYYDHDAVAGMDSEEEENKNDAELSIGDKIQRVAQMLNAIDVSKVTDAVVKEADDLIQKIPAYTFGGHGDAGKIIFRSLFIMFGNPLNLWWGNSRVNSRLPRIYTRTIDKMKAEETKDKLLALADTWTEDEEDTIDATACMVAGMAIKEADDTLPEGTSEQEAFNTMLEQANTALVLLEVDFQPGSLAESDEIKREDRHKLISLGCELHEQKIAMEHGRYFNQAKVMEFFALMHHYPESVAAQSN